MQLLYGGKISRLVNSRSGIGSQTGSYVVRPTIYPMDVSPIDDNTVMQQTGQQDMLTHIIHFQAGTDVKDRDEVTIVYAPQPGNFGNVGDVYFIAQVLQPSTDLNYIRCRAFKKLVVTG